jgi:hypothetical protein
MKLLVMQFSPTSVTPSLFGPNILLNTLFSKTLSLCSCLTVRDHDSHPYRTKNPDQRNHFREITMVSSGTIRANYGEIAEHFLTLTQVVYIVTVLL